MTSTDTRADLYLRLSDLRDTDLDEHGRSSLDGKEQLLRERAAALGWQIARVVIENDALLPRRGSNGRQRPASAFKRVRVRKPDGTWAETPDGRPLYRVLRPGFRSVLDDINAGRANAILAEDLDRVCRDPVDLEDLLSVMQDRRASARSLTGSLTLDAGGTTDQITMARVMVAMAWKASADTARRVTQSRKLRAAQGRNGGGRRPYGFQPDTDTDPKLPRKPPTIIEAEAQVIRDAAEAVLRAPVSHAGRSDLALADDGVTLKAIARDLRERGVPTVTGAAWTADTLKQILLRPMNCGLVLYQGEILDVPDGDQPAWMTDPILPRDVWENVVARLTDPARTTTPGNAPKWLCSGIALCGICDDGTVCRVGNSASGYPRYQCKSGLGHLARAAVAVDDWVMANMVKGLARQGARPVRPGAGIDVQALRRERQGHERRLNQIALDLDADLITRSQAIIMTRIRRDKIEAIDRELARAATTDPTAELAGKPEDIIRAKLEGMRLEQRRVILRALYTVTILPAAGRGPRFDRESVTITPTSQV
jgi:site-specific DNA recombinase